MSCLELTFESPSCRGKSTCSAQIFNGSSVLLETFRISRLSSRLIPPTSTRPFSRLTRLCVVFQVVKMLISLVVAFAVCWFPLNLFNLVLDLHPSLLDQIKTRDDERLLIGLFYACHWLAMASCFANPIIYSFFNESFRVSLQSI